ncbi:hypothetical protein ACFT38_38710 [Streptomyces sp. NPDC056975]|uniref:hypothetical protein n=1 Tax=Streptomyces sp. NPDC056975 TaxID=3345985 RepID=UPI003626DCDA
MFHPGSWPTASRHREPGHHPAGEEDQQAAQAAWDLGLGGAGQTLGRTLYAALARRTAETARTTALIALGGTTTAALAAVPSLYALLAVLSVAAGMVRGK